MTEADAFVQSWSKVWRRRESDAQLYMELLHKGCPLINPIKPITREDRPEFVEAVVKAEPDIRVVPTRWAGTDDGSVLIEWVNTGTLHGAPLELRGADRYTLRDGEATEGHAVDLWPRYETRLRQLRMKGGFYGTPRYRRGDQAIQRIVCRT